MVERWLSGGGRAGYVIAFLVSILYTQHLTGKSCLPAKMSYGRYSGFYQCSNNIIDDTESNETEASSTRSLVVMRISEHPEPDGQRTVLQPAGETYIPGLLILGQRQGVGSSIISGNHWLDSMTYGGVMVWFTTTVCNRHSCSLLWPAPGIFDLGRKNPSQQEVDASMLLRRLIQQISSVSVWSEGDSGI